MVADPRISDKELAAINAAAVTKEYRVQPHLGLSFTVCVSTAHLEQTTGRFLLLTGL